MSSAAVAWAAVPDDGDDGVDDAGGVDDDDDDDRLWVSTLCYKPCLLEHSLFTSFEYKERYYLFMLS